MDAKQARTEYDKLHDAYLAEKDPAKRKAFDKLCDDFIEEHAEALGLPKTPAPKPTAAPAPSPVPSANRVSLVRDEARRVAAELGVVDLARAIAAVKPDALGVVGGQLDDAGRAAIRRELVGFALAHREAVAGRPQLTPAEVLEAYEAAAAASRNLKHHDSTQRMSGRALFERIVREYGPELRAGQDARHQERAAHEQSVSALKRETSALEQRTHDAASRARHLEARALELEAQAASLEVTARPGTQSVHDLNRVRGHAKQQRDAAAAAKADAAQLGKDLETKAGELATLAAPTTEQ